MVALLPLIPMPTNHPLSLLFQAQCLLQLNYPNMNEAFYCETLLGPDYFPNNLWIMTLRAKILFNLHGESLQLLKYDTTLMLYRARRIGASLREDPPSRPRPYRWARYILQYFISYRQQAEVVEPGPRSLGHRQGSPRSMLRRW
jgi:hypothetical protein